MRKPRRNPRPVMEAEIPQLTWVPPGGEEDLSRYSGVSRTRSRKVPALSIGVQDNVDEAVGVGTANIMAVYLKATPEEQDFWGQWYTHAQDDVKRLAAKYALPFPYVAAMAAVLSPGNRWDMNLRAVERAILLAAKFLGSKEQLAHERAVEAASTSAEKKALDKEYKALVQAFGASISAYPANIRKAVQVLVTDTIAPWVSGKKVSEFYAALVNPESVNQRMVLDGHAISIWLGRKLALHEVPSAEGARRKKMLESYRQAAEQLGVTPRAVQAVTWYVWRSVSKD